MTHMLVDAHCHLDLMAHPSVMAEEAERNGISVIAVTNAPSVYYFTRDIAQKHHSIHAAVGLHPELVHSHSHEAVALYSNIASVRFIGEVGLDYTSSEQNIRRLQRQVFEGIVEACRRCGDRVLSIHSRRAATDTIAILGGGFPGHVILHWFSGSKVELDQAIKNGYYFSVNPAMVASAKGKRLVEAIPHDRVLTESDGPFVRINGQPATPMSVHLAVTTIGKIWRCIPEEAAQTVFDNFRRIVPEDSAPI